MKINHKTFGLLIIVSAVGSAYGNTLQSKPSFAKAIVHQNGPVTCVALQRTCDDVGQLACRVQLNVQVGANITSDTYENSSCTIPLQSGSELQQSDVVVYQVF